MNASMVLTQMSDFGAICQKHLYDTTVGLADYFDQAMSFNRFAAISLMILFILNVLTILVLINVMRQNGDVIQMSQNVQNLSEETTQLSSKLVLTKKTVLELLKYISSLELDTLDQRISTKVEEIQKTFWTKDVAWLGNQITDLVGMVDDKATKAILMNRAIKKGKFAKMDSSQDDVKADPDYDHSK